MSTRGDTAAEPRAAAWVDVVWTDILGHAHTLRCRAWDPDDPLRGLTIPEIDAADVVVAVDGEPRSVSRPLRLSPDPSTLVPSPWEPGVMVVMADIVELDGSPWDGCPRTQLKQALAALKQAAGLSMVAAFEQEFLLLPATADPTRIADHAFSVAAFRGAGDFGPMLATCLEEAAVEPEMILPE